MTKGVIGLILGVALAVVVSFTPLAGASSTSPHGTTPYTLPNQSWYDNHQQTGIWVTGEGSVSVVPDVAILTLGVEAQEDTVEEAMDEASEAMDAIIEALLDNGVAEEDIQTRWFTIYPVRDWINGHAVLLGYEVSNTVTVKIRDMDNVGHIIDEVAEAGGDLTRISGVSFTIDDPDPYYDQAREEAILDAMAEAQQMASLTGVGLGPPIYISEGYNYAPYPVYMDYSYAAYGEGNYTTPISPGQTEVSVTVQIVFSIEY